jgi:hypothetical protein
LSSSIFLQIREALGNKETIKLDTGCGYELILSHGTLSPENLGDHRPIALPFDRTFPRYPKRTGASAGLSLISKTRNGEFSVDLTKR